MKRLGKSEEDRAWRSMIIGKLLADGRYFGIPGHIIQSIVKESLQSQIYTKLNEYQEVERMKRFLGVDRYNNKGGK
jgi:hypothetical protein